MGSDGLGGDSKSVRDSGVGVATTEEGDDASLLDSETELVSAPVAFACEVEDICHQARIDVALPFSLCCGAGHSRCVAGTAGDDCRVSHRWHGRAVDISAVNGAPVRRGNVAAMALAEWLGRLPPELLPAEVGSSWQGLTPPEIHFSDSMHADHLHAGWPAR